MLHVYPLDDIEEHDTSDNGNTCKCDPQVIIQDNAEIIVVHNSFDGREGVEWVNEILNK
jgi:hypothetical protein